MKFFSIRQFQRSVHRRHGIERRCVHVREPAAQASANQEQEDDA